MNERIKKLALQAKTETNNHFGDQTFDWSDWHKLYDAKFAELMVLEMCTVLDRAQWDKGEDWVCADGTRIIPTVKNHFGVEE